MQTIYKYPIEENKEEEKLCVKFPRGGQVISATGITAMQTGSGARGFLYVIVENEEEEKEEREVLIYGTGWPIKERKELERNFEFLGTFKEGVPRHLGGELTWHVWVERAQVYDDKEQVLPPFEKLLC